MAIAVNRLDVGLLDLGAGSALNAADQLKHPAEGQFSQALKDEVDLIDGEIQMDGVVVHGWKESRMRR